MPPQTSYTYDLTTGTPVFSGFTSTDGGPSQWAVPGLSADGTTLVENFAPLYGIIGAQTGAFDPATGSQLTATGLEGEQLWMPTFSPDNQLIAYVNGTTHDLHAVQWDPTLKQASNDQIIVASSANPSAPQIQYPTVSPDHQWIVVPARHRARVPRHPRRSLPGERHQPRDGDRSRDARRADAIPSPPVDATSTSTTSRCSRPWPRAATSGSSSTRGARTATSSCSRRTSEPGVGLKQLWVAAFDQSPTAGVDPSHSAFLPGRTEPRRAQHARLLVAEPCLADGQSCQMGTDCCGGYCNGAPDGGATDAGLVCGQPSRDARRTATSARRPPTAATRPRERRASTRCARCRRPSRTAGCSSPGHVRSALTAGTPPHRSVRRSRAGCPRTTPCARGSLRGRAPASRSSVSRSR